MIKFFRQAIIPLPYPLSLSLSLSRAAPHTRAPPPRRPPPPSSQPRTPSPVNVCRPSLSPSRFRLFLTLLQIRWPQPSLRSPVVVARSPSSSLYSPSVAVQWCSRHSLAVKHPATAVTDAGVCFGFDVLGRLRPFYITYQEFLADFQFGLRRLRLR